MGDFNDEPRDVSLSQILQAKSDITNVQMDSIYNLSKAPGNGKVKGTVKFRGEWTLFDQVIVSGSLLVSRKGLHVRPDDYHIFGESFLLAPDEQYNGYKPFRTYNGYKYQGGFSDHLPVYVDLEIVNGMVNGDADATVCPGQMNRWILETMSPTAEHCPTARLFYLSLFMI